MKETSKQTALKKRWQAFIKEDRTWKSRVIQALLVNVFFAFTLLIFAPCESFVINIDFLKFTFKDLWWCMFAVAIIYLVVSTLICSFCKGKVYDIVLSFIFAFTLCAYLQGNYLNINMGTMDGRAIEWQKYSTPALINAIIWLFLLELPFLVYYFSKKAWKNMLMFGSAFIIAMQAVAFIFLLFTTDFTAASPMAASYLTEEKMFELSADENVVVFVLDAFDAKYMEEILAKDKDNLQPLKDFTFFPNMTSAHFRTFPSLTYLLTQEMFYNDIPADEYLETAWGKAEFLKQLKTENYDTRLLMLSEHLGTGARELVDNIADTERDISYIGLVSSMVDFIGYRYMPQALKPSFWYYTDDINNQVVISGNKNASYGMNDPVFYELLRERRLTTREDKNCFRLYHLHGAHTPYFMNENAKKSDSTTDCIAQSKGSLYIVYEYIEQMKALGIYEDAVIVITADHGISSAAVELDYASNPLFLVKKPGMQNDEMKISNAPVSQGDFQATIMDGLSKDYKKFGSSAFDIAENESRERLYLFTSFYNGDKEDKLIEYKIDGDATDFGNWSKTAREWKSRYSIYAIRR